MAFCASWSCAAYPLNSCPSVSGTASCRWVRPILMIWLNAWAFFVSEFCRRVMAGNRLSCMAATAARCIEEGMVSLVDWDMLTWSLGCTGIFPPRWPVRSSLARLARTSLTFMLNWVPLPLCQMTSGKWS